MWLEKEAYQITQDTGYISDPPCLTCLQEKYLESLMTFSSLDLSSLILLTGTGSLSMQDCQRALRESTSLFGVWQSGGT